MELHEKIDRYFASKGITVHYNMLNRNTEISRRFIQETRDLYTNCGAKSSKDIKSMAYAKFYDMAPRPKYTGFENFKKLDALTRTELSAMINESPFVPVIQLKPDLVPLVKTTTYSEALEKSFNDLHRPLLYLSGGLDSEFVAITLIKSGIKFKPVIFNYVDNHGVIQNSFDTAYAFQFCKNNGLEPIVRTINIPELWGSFEFKMLACDVGYTSPQLATHAYMVKLMDMEFPYHQHLFGGEILWYKDNGFDDDNNYVDLLYQAKLGYGLSYTSTAPTSVGQLGTYINGDGTSATYLQRKTYTLTGTGGYSLVSTTNITDTIIGPSTFYFNSVFNSILTWNGIPGPQSAGGVYVYGTGNTSGATWVNSTICGLFYYTVSGAPQVGYQALLLYNITLWGSLQPGTTLGANMAVGFQYTS